MLRPQTGELVAKRHDLWRTFDFVWMFHIMDYEDRTDMNNTLLRVATWMAVATSATGGWRAQDASPEGFADGDAELKRMYVVPAARGRGLARRVLAALEDSAAAAGRLRMVLETGLKQPKAIALYTSSGYVSIPKFGVYRCEPDSVCFGRPLDAGAGSPGPLQVGSTAR